MASLTATQRKALDIIQVKGVLFCGNGISLSTVRVLERLGLIALEFESYYTNPTMHARLGGSKPRLQTDWIARPATPKESNRG